MLYRRIIFGLTDCDGFGVGVVDQVAEGLDATLEARRSGGHVGQLVSELAKHLVGECGHRGHLPKCIAQRAVGDGVQLTVPDYGHSVFVVQLHPAQVYRADGALYERHGEAT